MLRIRSFFVAAFLFAFPVAGMSEELVAIPKASTEQVRAAVDKGIAYIQAESSKWLSTRKCAACHHAPMPIWALAEAERQGYAIDKKYLTDTVESSIGSREQLIAVRLLNGPNDQPDPRPQARGLNMGLPFLAVAARSMPTLSDNQKQTLQLIAEEIQAKQQSDGSWEFFAGLRRPPINETQLTDAAWIIMALEAETTSDSAPAQRLALIKAKAWYDVQSGSNLQQEKAMKLLVRARCGQSKESFTPAIDELLSLQRADGGWSQTVPELKSDAFATGQTLYVLSEAGFAQDRPEIQRAINFLVATQTADGSWPMISRSTPDGSEGSSKLLTPITCAASSWAILGMTRYVHGPN